VAGDGGSVCGFAYAGPWRPKSAYRYTVEDSVYLAPGWTGRGIGTALLTELLRRCAETGVRQVIAVIADTGTPASAALHDYLGFAEVGKLPKVGCKHGRWIDTVLMQKDLTDERADRAGRHIRGGSGHQATEHGRCTRHGFREMLRR
jgi:phosphinothricin acetyltransferase